MLNNIDRLSLGKGEVVSSILTGSTMISNDDLDAPKQKFASNKFANPFRLADLSRAERADLEFRFWLKVRRGEPGECWEWQAASNEAGYGRIRVAGHLLLAHRVSYELANGPSSKRRKGIYRTPLVCHRCDNPKCVNPDHLFAGSYTANARDGVRKGRPIGRPPTRKDHD